MVTNIATAKARGLYGLIGHLPRYDAALRVLTSRATMLHPCRGDIKRATAMFLGRHQLSAILGVLALTGSLASGGAASYDPVVQKGLQHTEQSRDLVEKALGITNQLLAHQGAGLTLTSSWQSKQSTAGAEDVSVYLVSASKAASTTPAAAPKNCRCVFVNPAAFQAFMDAQTNGPGRMKLDGNYVLTFMLLHEVGHLKKRSSATDFENGELAQLNTSASLDKKAEKEADQFAAEAVRAGLKKGGRLGIEAAWVSQALVILSWNMQAYISLDNFGATAMGAPVVFFDKNLSHPNLIWRVLSVNHLIQQTDTASKLLESFEAARDRGANPVPLYVKPAAEAK